MTNIRLRSADERRAEIQTTAQGLGIDQAYISLLVETFYARVRREPRIGPIFEAAIGEDWDHHLAKLKDFWASVALSTGQYSGKPVPAHQKHSHIKPADFEVWLGLFEQTLRDTAPKPETVPFFMERAGRIAQSLQLALYGMPELKGRTG